MGDFTAAIIAISVLFVLFLIGRELVCWYFKINQTVALLEEIRDLLKSKS